MADPLDLESVHGRVLRGTAGEALRAVVYAPPSPDQLERFLDALPIRLSGTFLDFLRLTDGMNLFGIPISGAGPGADTHPDTYQDLVRRRLLPFHDWSNGDFDCLDLTKVVDGEPPVAFWNDETEQVYPITHGFGRWMKMAVFEVETHGKLLHPRDYFDPRFANAQGVYESIANVKKTFGAVDDGPYIPPPRVRRRDRAAGWLRRLTSGEPPRK